MPQVFDPSQFNVTQAYGQSGEVGVDVGLKSGTPVYAPWAGTAAVVDYGATRTGLTVYTRLPSGGFDYIGHLRKATVQSGDTIQPGQLLGYSGGALTDPSHGNSTGPHIEFAVGSPTGQFSDPLPTLRQLESSGPASPTDAGAANAVTTGFSIPGLPGFVTQPGAPDFVTNPPDLLGALPGKIVQGLTDAVGRALSGFLSVLGHGIANVLLWASHNIAALIRQHLIAFAVAGVVLALLFLR